MTQPRWFWLVAGSNGAGKSTHGRAILAVPTIDPDNPLPGQTLDPMAAGRRTLAWVDDRVVAQESFAVETTLSGSGYLRTARTLRKEGWNIGVLYVGLESAELAISRVSGRHQMGGHTVPEPDIRRRYARSLRNLPEAIAIADEVLVFDNSSDTRGIELVLRLERGQTTFRANPLPQWLATALGEQP